MDKLIEENLIAVLKREGLEPKAGDLEQFVKNHRACTWKI